MSSLLTSVLVYRPELLQSYNVTVIYITCDARVTATAAKEAERPKVAGLLV
jgi:hypothetical protein